jgi:hypothetical protein
MDYRYGSHTVFKIEYHFVWGDEISLPGLKWHEVWRVIVSQTPEVNSRLNIRRVVQSTRIRTFSP